MTVLQVKPKKESFKELNVDLSCLDLPVQAALGKGLRSKGQGLGSWRVHGGLARWD